MLPVLAAHYVVLKLEVSDRASHCWPTSSACPMNHSKMSCKDMGLIRKAKQIIKGVMFSKKLTAFKRFHDNLRALDPLAWESYWRIQQIKWSAHNSRLHSNSVLCSSIDTKTTEGGTHRQMPSVEPVSIIHSQASPFMPSLNVKVCTPAVVTLYCKIGQASRWCNVALLVSIISSISLL